MVKWELSTYYITFDMPSHLGIVVSDLWTKKDEQTGRTAWDDLTRMANDGWELVSVTPIQSRSDVTRILLYTFKRPIESPKDLQ